MIIEIEKKIDWQWKGYIAIPCKVWWAYNALLLASIFFVVYHFTR